MKKIVLDDGVEIPILGFGTWELTGQACIDSVEKALKTGYTHIDTADRYGNHREVGTGIKKSHIKREMIFLTTKLPPFDLSYDTVLENAKRYLLELQTDYLDLLLIHWPNRHFPLKSTIEAMDKLKKDGLVKSIGVSNFNIRHIQDAISTGFQISLNQIELHPTFYPKDLVKFCKNNKIATTAYSPFGRNSDLSNSKIAGLAQKYNVTPSQIILSWIFSKDIIAIPKSTNPKHIEENFKSLDLVLDEDDLKLIDQIPQNDRIVNPAWSDFGY